MAVTPPPDPFSNIALTRGGPGRPPDHNFRDSTRSLCRDRVATLLLIGIVILFVLWRADPPFRPQAQAPGEKRLPRGGFVRPPE